MAPSPLARLIRRRRLEIGFTKEEAARAAKVSLSTWHSIENDNGDGRFRDITLAGVAQAIDLDIDTVFRLGGSELPSPTVTLDGEARGANPPSVVGDHLIADICAMLKGLDQGTLAFVHRVAAAITSLDELQVGSAQRISEPDEG